MEEIIKTAGETAIITEATNASSVNPNNTLVINRDKGILRVTRMKDEPPVHVDMEVIKWACNAVLNFARLTVVPYNTKGKSYFYFIIELDGVVEEKGTYVNDDAIEIVLSLLRGEVKIPNTEFLDSKQEVNETEDFQMELLQRLQQEVGRFHRQPDKVRDGVTHFRGSFQFYRGEVKFDIPLNGKVEKFIHERLTISKIDYFNM